jgi:hypothetical protein
MDIGPISAIRPLTMVKPFPAAPDLSRVFEAEYLGQSSDDEYSPNNRKAARGLEDEDEESEREASAASDAPSPMGSGSVSLFA